MDEYFTILENKQNTEAEIANTFLRNFFEGSI